MPEKKPFWETKNPRKKSTPLTAKQKSAAKARAKKAGRPYPNLVDNAAAQKFEARGKKFDAINARAKKNSGVMYPIKKGK